MSGVPDFPHAIFWGSGNYVEEFYPAVRMAAVGNDTMPVVGHAPAGDRLVIFKRNSFHEFYSIGNDQYGQRSINDDGIGSLGSRSLVSAITPQGTLVYFQAQTGHFYATDGQGLLPLSLGRMDVFVSLLNMTALDKTYGFMNPATGEIGWSVCTGSNTTPDKTVIYNPAMDAFSIETGAADIWALDYITTAGEINVIGSSNCGLTPANKIFHWRKAAYDIDAATGIEAIWESTDYHLGNPNSMKHWRSLIDRMSAAAIRSVALNNTLTLSWYLDGSSTAAGTTALTFDALNTVYEKVCRYLGRARTIRFKISGTDVSGSWKVGMREIESEYVRTVVR